MTPRPCTWPDGGWFGLAVITGWALLGLGELTDWRWCSYVAFAVFVVTLLVQSWHFGRWLARVERERAAKAGRP